MKIKIAAIQLKPEIGNLGYNFSRTDELVKSAVYSGAELIVLPEICDIGYHLGIIKDRASEFPNESTNFLSNLAKSEGIYIVAGLPEKKTDKIYNSALIFNEKGEISARYDKIHLCPVPPINEPGVFSPGSKILITEIKGIKVGVSICFDIRFPELYRKMAMQGAELIVHPTAFPRIRIKQLEICVRARSLENQFFMVSANHTGFSGIIELGGRSMIIGPDGDIRAMAGETDEEIVFSEIDTDDIITARAERPIFSQIRSDIY